MTSETARPDKRQAETRLAKKRGWIFRGIGLQYNTSDLLLYDTGDLMLDNTGDCLGDDLHDFALHDTLDLLLYDLRDFPAHYLTHLLSHRSLNLLADGLYNFMLHGDLQLFLHDVPHFLRHRLFHWLDVRYLVDGILSQRTALVYLTVHTRNSFQDGFQPELLNITALVSALTRDFLPFQRASVKFL